MIALGCSDSEPAPHHRGDEPHSDERQHRSDDRRPTRDASARAAAIDAGTGSVAITLDGKPIATVLHARLSEPVALSELIDVPISDWKVVEGYASEHRTLKLRKPPQTYPDQKVMLFVGDKGNACFGTFLREDKAPEKMKHLLGKPRLFVRGIVEVRIRTKEEPALEVKPAVLEIAVGGKVTKLSADRLAKLRSREHSANKQQAWDLADVIALVSKRRPERLLVTDGRTELEIPGTALRDAKHRITIRLNRRGLYKLSWSGPEDGASMRGVTRIDVSF